MINIYVINIEELKNKAEAGNVEAQYELAHAYDHGEAQYVLANFFFYGEVVKKDINEAFKWYKLSAEQGDKRAQNCVGVCYLDGIGTEVNKEEGFNWFRKSAEQGFDEAQYNLALCYHEGDGVEKNMTEASNGIKDLLNRGMIMLNTI